MFHISVDFPWDMIKLSRDPFGIRWALCVYLLSGEFVRIFVHAEEGRVLFHPFGILSFDLLFWSFI
jgi:hypothetical protein